MTDPGPTTIPNPLPQAHEPWRLTAAQWLESLGWAPLRRARRLRPYGGNGESAQARLTSFIRAGSGDLPPDAYAWVAVTTERVRRAMWLEEPRPVILRSMGWAKGLRRLEQDLAGAPPEKTAGLIIATVREPDRVEPGSTRNRWQLGKRSGGGGWFGVEIKAGSDFLEIMSVAEDR